MKKFLVVLVLCLLACVSFGYTKNAYVAESANGITIWSTPNATVVDGFTVYIKGHYDENVASRTTTATYATFPDSMSFTTEGGLYPGTTWFIFGAANKNTLTKLANWSVNVATYTPGVEGGIVISTVTPEVGAIVTSSITTGLSGSCFGSDNAATVTVTLVPTLTFQITDSSCSFISTGGLYQGLTGYVFPATETLAQMKTRLEAWPTTTVGLEGSLNVAIPEGVYDVIKSSFLAITAATNIYGITNATTINPEAVAILGMTYIIPASDVAITLTNLVVNATYGSGSVSINIYDGATTSSPQIRKEVGAATTVDKLVNLPSEGLVGTRGKAMRIDVVGTVAITNGIMNLIFK